MGVLDSLESAIDGHPKESLKILCVKIPSHFLIATINNIANIARGIIEMVPVFGNIFCGAVDNGCSTEEYNCSFEDRSHFPLIKDDAFKTAGYRPFVSIGVGIFRAVTRTVTLIYDPISIPVFGVLNSLENLVDDRPKEALKTLCVKIPRDTLIATISNITNSARGIIEMVPFVGNGLCLALDKPPDDLDSSLYERIKAPLIKDDILKTTGYRPLFSTGSGVFRVVTRVVALVHDIFAVPLFGVCDSIEEIIKRNPREALKTLCVTIPRDTLTATISNIVNIARGIIEIVPLIGSALCYTFDNQLKNSKWSLNNRTHFPLIKNDSLKIKSHPLSGAFRVVTRATTLIYDPISIPILGLLSSLEKAIDGHPKKALKGLCIKIPRNLLTATISNIANIARGIIEMVPLLGTGLCYAFDNLSQISKWSLHDRTHFPLIKEDDLKRSSHRPVSTITGTFRVMTRTATLIYDPISIPIFGVLSSLERAIDGYPKKALKRLCIKIPRDLLTATISNTANIARGIIEMVPLLGNGLCYGFDIVSDKLSAFYRARRGAR